jgi:phosphotransferase system enzyme I (PtsI)
MKILRGQKASDGIAIGKIWYLSRKPIEIKARTIDDVPAELAHVETARKKVIDDLEVLYQDALKKLGAEEAELFQTHQMMLSDLDYTESVTGIITNEKKNAEYAVTRTSDMLAEMFKNMDSEYLRARAADVRDISNRLLDALQGNDPVEISSDEPVIVAAEDLRPSETLLLDKNKVLAFVTAGGSHNSHTAILARNMGIPAVVALGIDLAPDCDGRTAIVDGAAGVVYMEPDSETAIRLRRMYETKKEEDAVLAVLKGQENCTIDGKRIELFANIGNTQDIDAVLANDAQGIGLFRSEFLYLERKDFPTEEQQFAAYKTVAEKMAGRQVIIRTLDIGADKQADYFKLPPEENPAMGLRALRICLTRPGVFITQLRAIYRASAYGNIAIMLPMVASVWEVRKAFEMAAEARKQLTQEHKPFAADIKHGIMIETPAAAITSDLLAREVDFFSIGTNDLTQYTLAADRQNNRLNEFVDTRHPAVLRFIRLIAENAHKAGIPVGICGELAADPSLTESFLQMGIDELSVPPPAILGLRKKIRLVTEEKMREQ